MNALKVKRDVYRLFMAGNDHEDVIKWHHRVTNMLLLCGVWTIYDGVTPSVVMICMYKFYK